MKEEGKITEVKENKSKADDFKLERYKFILQQLNLLNEATQKYITLFQTLATAVLGVGIAIYAAWQEEKIISDAARLGITAVLWLFTLLTIFVILSMITNALAWFDYRQEEVELLSKEVGKDFRKSPTWRNLWRWNETIFTIFLVIMSIGVWVFAKYWLIPSINP